LRIKLVRTGGLLRRSWMIWKRLLLRINKLLRRSLVLKTNISLTGSRYWLEIDSWEKYVDEKNQIIDANQIYEEDQKDHKKVNEGDQMIEENQIAKEKCVDEKYKIAEGGCLKA
jgi:hypothetical protein